LNRWGISAVEAERLGFSAPWEDFFKDEDGCINFTDKAIDAVFARLTELWKAHL